MCGIVGYIGRREALPILINGLKALEYRGYDSAGVAILADGAVGMVKSAGKVSVLEERTREMEHRGGLLGIAHTRWATHGVPNETNAHPHRDCAERVFLVHNGIIENYQELKTYLAERGHTFVSETDTEIVAHLIEEQIARGKDFRSALFDSLGTVRGAYALAVVDAHDPETLYAARLSSPLVIGIGSGENFIASDPSALVGNTKEILYLKDGEVAEISRTGVSVTSLDRRPVPPEIIRLEWNLEQSQKGNFPHFMLKEIFEGPDVVSATLRGRLRAKERLVKLGGLEQVSGALEEMKRLVILACGTSYYAGLIGEYLFEEIAGIPTEVHFASEFRYRTEPFGEGTVALAISQSGETADTLAALRRAKSEGLLTLGVVNVVGSTIARETDAGVYNHAGPEIGVASTKAFLSQLTVLVLMACAFARGRTRFDPAILTELEAIPGKIRDVLKSAPQVEALARAYRGSRDFLFLGRRYSYPVALEGALKLKEVSYVHSEGYGAGEMKHGPIALVSPEFPTLAVVPKNSVSEKMYSNLEEIRARKGPIVAIATEGDRDIRRLASEVISVPATLEPLEPFLTVVPLQLFAYYMGTLRGYDVDKPRNLAKSVTVE